MLSRQSILEAERQENASRKRIGDALKDRSKGSKEFEIWKQACHAWHSSSLSIDFLWEGEFLRRLRSGEREAMEDSILFLEVDPWFFRSGYLKERLIRGLKAAPRDERDNLRLRNIIWNVANGPNRREFRKYCSLALKVTTKDFEMLIAGVSDAQNRESKGKLGCLKQFLALHKPDTEQGDAGNRI